MKDFFGKCDQIRTFLRKKSLMENLIFCTVLMDEDIEVMQEHSHSKVMEKLLN